MDKRIGDLVSFAIKEKSALAISADLIVNENLPSFEGHFPDNPILPAVSIIDISLSLLAETVPHISHINIEVGKSKFTEIVRPKHQVEISATGNDSGLWNILWREQGTDKKLAQVQLKVKPA